MNSIVCVKVVSSWVMDEGENQGIEKRIVSSYDLFALEYAIRLKECYGGKVTVLCMSPIGDAAIVKQLYAFGVDLVILLSDSAFAGSDTFATSRILEKAICCIEDYDLVLCGYKSVDGETAQVPMELGEKLGVFIYSNVIKINYSDERNMECISKSGEGIDVKRPLRLPAVLAIDKGNIRPRLPRFRNFLAASRKQVEIWNAQKINLSKEETGIKGSKTKVLYAQKLCKGSVVQIITGTLNEKVDKLLDVIL